MAVELGEIQSTFVRKMVKIIDYFWFERDVQFWYIYLQLGISVGTQELTWLIGEFLFSCWELSLRRKNRHHNLIQQSRWRQRSNFTCKHLQLAPTYTQISWEKLRLCRAVSHGFFFTCQLYFFCVAMNQIDLTTWVEMVAICEKAAMIIIIMCV